MTAYIEYLGAIAVGRRDLDDEELRSLGEFTRENVVRWFDSHRGPDWVGVCPVEDFHAVCGDIDLPWATEEGRRLWVKIREGGRLRAKLSPTFPAQELMS
jgi:hypothetical protein